MTTTVEQTTRGHAYRSDQRPDFTPLEKRSAPVKGFTFAGDLATELAGGALTAGDALDLLDDMLAVRELEEMIVRMRSGGGYEPLPGYDYRGPTHVSIGQEGAAVGASSALRADDSITSSHRGHGDAIAKGFSAIRQLSTERLAARLSRPVDDGREALLAAALEDHVYRTIAELFGKEDGYNRGRGGGMHIADYSTGNLGANAIVGGCGAHRDRRCDGHPLPAERPGRVLFRGRWCLRERRRPRVAELGRPGPVDEPPRGGPAVRPADHLLHPEQPLRDDASHRRRGHGRALPRPAGVGLRRERHARRGRQRHGRPCRARRGAAGRRAVPGRRGPGAHRGQRLPLLRPLALGSAQRVSDPGGGGGLARHRSRRPACAASCSRLARPTQATVGVLEREARRAQRRAAQRAAASPDPARRRS